MQQMMVYVAIILAFYVIGAYATTDILRLLKGNTLSVFSKDCFCPKCNQKISLKDQIPIFSYLMCKGKCRTCGNKIPKSDLVMEVFLFVTLTVVTVLFHFRYIAFVICVAVYEGLKVVCFLIFGVRKNEFGKNLFLSLLNNCLIWGMILILFILSNL